MNQLKKKQEILQQVETYLEKASEEDVEVFASLIGGLEKKQSGHCHSYLAGITHVESNYIGDNTYEMTIPIQTLIENPLKIVHGGITATLIDSAMGSLVNSLVGKHGQVAVTTEMKVNYLSPGVGNYLRCHATIVHKGKQLWVCEAKVYSDLNKLVAIANGSFFLIPKQPQGV